MPLILKYFDGHRMNRMDNFIKRISSKNSQGCKETDTKR